VAAVERVPVGRERELELVAELIAQHTDGCSALVFEGEPGIGKTTVLRAAIHQAQASGYRLATCRPAENEASLPFVSLGDLLEPALGTAFARLPPAQRTALETALALVDPTETFGRLAVSRATLAVLRELAAAAPLLIAIDDVQWLDRSTAEVLGFALRRLGDAVVRVVLTRRSGEDAHLIEVAGDLPKTRAALGALSLDELGRLIADRLEVPLTRPRLAAGERQATPARYLPGHGARPHEDRQGARHGQAAHRPHPRLVRLKTIGPAR
jgi:hypothetical protein